MQKNKIRLAIVGAGYMAQEHIRTFVDVEDVICAGIFSRTCSNAEAVAERFSIEKVFNSIDEPYSATQAQLAIIAVPELKVRKTCISALKYAWTIT